MVKLDIGNWDYDGTNASNPKALKYSLNPDNIQREISIKGYTAKQLDLAFTDTTVDNDYFFSVLGTVSVIIRIHTDVGAIRGTLAGTIHNAFTEAELKALDDTAWETVAGPTNVAPSTPLVDTNSRLRVETGKHPIIGCRLRLEGTVNPSNGQALIMIHGFNNRAAT